MSSQPLLHAKLDLAAIRMPWLNREFLLRASFSVEPSFCFARASSPCLFSSPISSRGDGCGS